MKALCGSPAWFRKGSRIIITTRDKNLARVEISKEESVRVGFETYKLKLMDETESVELFSWHAFKQKTPSEEFHELSANVVLYSSGLPLALDVLGSLLYGKDSEYWKGVLGKLKRIPNNDIQKKLRISFDALKDDEEKDIFLDIAFFFIGMDQSDVIQILDGCGFATKLGIQNLEERSLVTVDRDNKLGMHDLLRDMGREIVREKFPSEPERRSRLWYPKDIIDYVLNNPMEHQTIEGLTLKLPETETICTKAFKKKKKLRLLLLAGVKTVGNFEYVSRDLRWLCWHGFPFKYTPSPSKCYQGNLVAIELEYNNLQLVWKKAQMMKELKILNLSHSHNLTQTPDFSKLPNLKKLLLEDCPRLSSVSDTIEHLNELVVLNLKDCKGVQELPRSIYKMKSLETLIISGCSEIAKLEEDMEQMECLRRLIADDTAIAQVPYAIARLKNIEYISVCGYKGYGPNVVRQIIWSWTSPRNNLSSLMKTMVGMSHVSTMDTLALVDSRSQSIFGSNNFFFVLIGSHCPVIEILIERIFQKLRDGGSGDCLLPGNNNPEWLTFNVESDSITFEVPRVNGRNLKAVMLSTLYSSTPSMTRSEGLLLKNVLVINFTKRKTHAYELSALTSVKDEDWQMVLSNLEPGDQIQVVVFGDGFFVKRTAIYLIYAEPTPPIDQNMEDCHTTEHAVIDVDEQPTSIATTQVDPEEGDDGKEKVTPLPLLLTQTSAEQVLSQPLDHELALTNDYLDKYFDEPTPQALQGSNDQLHDLCLIEEELVKPFPSDPTIVSTLEESLLKVADSVNPELDPTLREVCNEIALHLHDLFEDYKSYSQRKEQSEKQLAHLDSLKADRGSLQSEFHTIKTRHSNHQSQKTKLEERIAEIDLEIAHLQSERQVLVPELERVTNILNDEFANKTRLVSEAQTLDQKISVLAAKEKPLRAAIANNSAKMRTVEKTWASFSSRFIAAKNSPAAISSAIVPYVQHVTESSGNIDVPPTTAGTSSSMAGTYSSKEC